MTLLTRQRDKPGSEGRGDCFGKRVKKNEFGAEHGEMYRKFGIISDKLFLVNRLEEAMDIAQEA